MAWITARKNKDGELYIGRDGKRRYDASYRDESGKKYKKTFTRKIDAEQWIVSEQGKIQRGEWTDPVRGKLRLRIYADQWLETKRGTAPRTFIKLDGYVRNHIKPVFGDSPLNSIQPMQVRNWVRLLHDNGLAPSTVKAIYQAFRQIMTLAVIDQRISKNPCVGIEMPRDRNQQEMHFLTAEEVAVLAEAICWMKVSHGKEQRDERHRCLILMAAYTGMRAGELHALHQSRLDLNHGVVHVREGLSEVPKWVSPTGMLLGPTKTGKSRSIRLPAPLIAALKEHLHAFPSEKGYVFPARGGGFVRHHNFFRRRFKPAAERAGLPEDLRFHDLRHTAAAFFIADGFNAKQLMDRLGHSSIRVTYDRYGHLFEGHDEDLLARLSERMKMGEGL